MDKQAGEEETRTEIACIDRWMNIQQLLNEAEYHLKNYGDRGMCFRPRQLTPSGISIILQMIRKPNSKIVVLFSQNNSQFKNKLNNAYLRRCLVHVYREGWKIKQGHPTSIFGNYLFGRRFEIQNFRNICCKMSCLSASPRIFEQLINGIIAHF